jgi:hypothetical protein
MVNFIRKLNEKKQVLHGKKLTLYLFGVGMIKLFKFSCTLNFATLV